MSIGAKFGIMNAIFLLDKNPIGIWIKVKRRESKQNF